MGMAASQARFLGLTARKTNVEYEGQQINQQRTTLSNQSANYYNQLLGMSVPVPPSVSDYTKTVYSFQDGSMNCNITSLTAQKGGTYLVSYTSSWTDDFSAVSAGSSIITRSGSDSAYKYSIGAKELRELNDYETDTDFTKEYSENYTSVTIDNKKYSLTKSDEGTGKDVVKYTYNDGTSEKTIYVDNTGKCYKDANKQNVIDNATAKKTATITKYSGNDEYLKSLSSDNLNKLMQEEEEYIKVLNEKYGEGTWLVRYLQNTTNGEYEPYFYKKEDIERSEFNANGSSLSYIPAYKIGSAQVTKETRGVQAQIEQDSTGRLINITFSEEGVTFALTTNTITDQAAYDDAMNQYEYDKYQYDQSIQEINAKIEIIQSEDKNLELRLKQLDTEQDAISNEMEAIQKVIDKNTESTFKTFG